MCCNTPCRSLVTQYTCPLLALQDLFEKTRIGTPWEDGESTNAILFGYLVAWFLGEHVHQVWCTPAVPKPSRRLRHRDAPGPYRFGPYRVDMATRTPCCPAHMHGRAAALLLAQYARAQAAALPRPNASLTRAHRDRRGPSWPTSMSGSPASAWC